MVAPPPRRGQGEDKGEPSQGAQGADGQARAAAGAAEAARRQLLRRREKGS